MNFFQKIFGYKEIEEKLNKQIESLTTEIREKLDVQLTEKEKNIAALKKEKEEQNELIKSLTEEKGNLQGQLTEKEKNIAALKKEKEEQNKQITKLTEEKGKIQGQLEEKEKQIVDLKTEREEQKERITKLSSEKDLALTDKIRIEEEKNKIASKLYELEKQYENSSSNNDKYEEELKKLRDELQKVQDDLKLKAEEIERLKIKTRDYACFDELRTYYNALSDEVKKSNNCRQIFGVSDNIVSVLLNVTKRANFDSFWSYLFESVDKNLLSQSDTENLRKMFYVVFKFMHSLDNNFMLLETKKGDKFDTNTMKKYSGTTKPINYVEEVLLLGYKNLSRIKQSLVS